jgi:hypothetical protein
MIDHGISIYDGKTTKTIGIWECIDTLKKQGITFPEFPVIQLLIDDRNTIQHRFGHPTAEAAYYYIEQILNFFQRLFNQYYNVQLVEVLRPHLSNELLELLGLIKDDILDNLERLANVSIEAAILRAYALIEKELLKLLPPPTSKSPSMRTLNYFLVREEENLDLLLTRLKQRCFLSQDVDIDALNLLRIARNYAAHNPEEISSNIDWQKAFKVAKDLIVGLHKANESQSLDTGDSGDNDSE